MRRLILTLPLLALAACKDKPKFIPPPDAGPICDGNTQLVNGECRFVCQRDGDCMAAERCNLFLGQCELKPPPPDAGPPPGTCTEGAVRCSADKKAIETCDANATWATTTTCPPPSGFCQNERCLVCQPGAASCASMTQLNICLDDGSATRSVTCTGASTCQGNECRECTPNAYRCNPANTALQQCQKTGDETATWKWANVGDNFDGMCITGQCRVGGGNGYECVPPACFPGQISCKDTRTAQTCGMTGAWVDAPCTASQDCQAGVCVDECADAIAAKSYFGCEYWSTVLDNSVDAYFKGGTLTGQGFTNSEAAYVVANRSVAPAQVTVTRWVGSAPLTVTTVTVPGRNDPGTKGLMTIQVPWQSISPAANEIGVSNTAQLRYGYRLTSTKPLTVYQFNPLSGTKYGKTCTTAVGTYDCACDEYTEECTNPSGCLFGCSIDPGSYSRGICDNAPGGGKKCRYNTFSNDASLLLPAHILGKTHVAVTEEHWVIGSGGGANSITSIVGDNTGYITIVGTVDGTSVTVKTSAVTKAGTGITAMAKGEMRTFTLNSYDVLQLASNNTGTTTVECAPFPFGGTGKVCRQDNDLSGTVITSSQPVAVFGGSPCTLKPVTRVACDHIEEQIFPFETWGKSFVAVQTAPIKLRSGATAPCPGTSCPPDQYKIVSGCPTGSPACPSGTTITITPNTAVSAVLPTNRCAPGSTLQPTGTAPATCRLVGITTVEFKSGVNFKVDSDQPIAVVQFFPGQGSGTGATTDPDEGDPSMVLLPPVEQWRGNYTVLAGPTFRSNYLGLSIDITRVSGVNVDGTMLPSSSFALVGSSTIAARNYPVPGGTHVIQAIARPVQPPGADGGVYNAIPGVGVTAYGYDSYVSYGYTGGLDLQSIVTGINPGG